MDMSWAAPCEKSNMYCVAVLDQTGERTMFCFVPPWADFPRFSEKSFEAIPETACWKQADEAQASEEEILFTSGMAILEDVENNKAVLDFFRRRKAAGAKVVFDLNVRAESYGYEGARRSAMEDMISISDIILGSGADEFSAVTGSRDLHRAAGLLLESMQAGTVIARNGGGPILILGEGADNTDGTIISVRPVEVVSTLGAGDAFDAMFLKQISQGTPIPQAVRTSSDYAGELISGASPI